MRFSLFTTALIGAISIYEGVQALNLADSEVEPLDVCTAEIDIALEADKDINRAVEKLQRAMAARSALFNADPMYGSALFGGCGCCNAPPPQTLVLSKGCGSCNDGYSCGSCNSCCKKDCEELKKPLGQRVREFYCIQQKMCKGDKDWCKAKEECEAEEKALSTREEKCKAITAKEECTKDDECKFESDKCSAKSQKELDKDKEEAAKAKTPA